MHRVVTSGALQMLTHWTSKKANESSTVVGPSDGTAYFREAGGWEPKMVQHPCTPLSNLWIFEWPPDSYLIGLFSVNLSPAEIRAGPLHFQNGAS